MKQPSKLYLPALLWLMVCFACNTHSPALTPGVSLELAQQRKATVSRLSYVLSLDIPGEKEAAIVGSELISFQLADAGTNLQLDFKEATERIKAIWANGQPISINHRHEHIVIPSQALVAGNNTVKIDFLAGNLSLNRNDDYLYTLLVPDRARTVFPCFDQPNLKASFQLNLTVPEGWQAMTNGPRQDSTVANGRVSYQFAPSDTISTYLFAFAAGRFQRVSRSVDGREMNFFHRETDAEKLGESIQPIFELHTQALAFLEEYTGIAYPFKKFDFIAIPDFQYGGMEHVGAIQYRASSLFLDKTATESQKIGRANLIAHETAHMWFGDLVTMDWFNDVWMKEVFANFMADKVSEVTFPNTGAELKFLLNHYPAAYSVDRTPGANPVRQELDNLQEAGTLYGAIIYHKAPIVMKQLELLMGRESFRTGLQEYLRKFAFSNSNWTDLIRILDDLTEEDLAAWNKIWVEEPFRPVFSVKPAPAGVTITQRAEQQAGTETGRVWPQYFTTAFGFKDSLLSIPTHSSSDETTVAGEAAEAPDYIAFNTSGEGYGVFPVDTSALRWIAKWTDPVARAAAYINNFENMLNGTDVTPQQLIDLNLEFIKTETEELSIRQLTSQLYTAFWQYTTPANRELAASGIEDKLWRAMAAAPSANIRKQLFQSYRHVATTDEAIARLYDIWHRQAPPSGVQLSEDDYTELAAALCILGHPKAATITSTQLSRIGNADRKLRWQFLTPALSADGAERLRFFECLKAASQREKEAWVSTALGYLHHPLRQNDALPMLRPSLDLLMEIQATGDIFFPTAWLSSIFGSYQSVEAAGVVSDFLTAHPDYPPRLKAKILQTTDDLMRASRMLYPATGTAVPAN